MGTKALKTKGSALKTLILVLTPTLIISPTNFLDPINWPKQIALFGVLPIILFELYRHFRPVLLSNKIQNCIYLIALILFLAPMILNWSGLTRTFWGTWGRNNGLATILSLLIIAYTTSILVKIEEFPRLITLFLSILFIPATLYGLVQAFLTDPLDWSVKGSVFSFFGNTNFASSIFALVSLASILCLTGFSNSAANKVLLTFQSVASFIVMIATDSIQGLVAFLIGLSLLIYFKLSLVREHLSRFFASIIVVIGSFTFISFLGIGPLGETLYQYTLKLRTFYWIAGLEMGFSNPIFGVGVDSYGDFYRQFRSLETAKTTSIDLTVNNAHNAAIQIFATLGLIGLTAYLLLFIPALVFSIKFLLKPQKNWSTNRATIVTLFIASFSVSMISIDNISIAVITWMLAGAVSGFHFQSKHNEKPVTFKSLEDLNNSKQFHKRNLSIDTIKPIALTALTFLFFLGSYFKRRSLSNLKTLALC